MLKAIEAGIITISIHAPREGSDKFLLKLCQDAGLFLSTLPARGATCVDDLGSFEGSISIHAPREGSDTRKRRQMEGEVQFLSTLPARGATLDLVRRVIALRHFYPRSPRGERPGSAAVSSGSCRFLSTLPARGATRPSRSPPATWTFLSTLPARGAT